MGYNIYFLQCGLLLFSLLIAQTNGSETGEDLKHLESYRQELNSIMRNIPQAYTLSARNALRQKADHVLQSILEVKENLRNQGIKFDYEALKTNMGLKDLSEMVQLQLKNRELDKETRIEMEKMLRDIASMIHKKRQLKYKLQELEKSKGDSKSWPHDLWRLAKQVKEFLEH